MTLTCLWLQIAHLQSRATCQIFSSSFAPLLLHKMAFILGLPNETLLQIIGELFPEDHPSFALSCKHILALSQKSLIQYVERKKKYAAVKFLACSRHDNESNLRALLQEMFDDHRMASYPTSILVKTTDCGYNCGSFYEDCPGDGLEEQFYDREESEYSGVGGIKKLKNIINGFESATTKKQRENDDQLVGIRTRGKLYPTGQWKLVLGLLLSTLPNIKTLTLRVSMAFEFQQVLLNVIERSRGLCHTGPTVLTKLKTIFVDGFGTVYHGDTDFDSLYYGDAGIFGCFGLLPSVERLFGVRIVSRELRGSRWNEHRYHWRGSDDLAITDIKFEHSKLGLHFFSQLLRRVTRLRRFTYGLISGSVGTDGTDPYRLIDLLLLRSKKTLEHLELKGFASQKTSPPHGAGQGSLRDFEALKDVCVHSSLWILSEIHPKTTRSSEGFCRTEEVIVTPLVETLPSCVENVQLRGPIHIRDVNDLLDGLAGSKGRRLRSLKTINFRDVERPPHSFEVDVKKWTEEYAELGIKLKLQWATLATILD